MILFCQTVRFGRFFKGIGKFLDDIFRFGADILEFIHELGADLWPIIKWGGIVLFVFFLIGIFSKEEDGEED